MFEKEAEEYGEKDLGGKYLSSVVAKDKLHAYKLGQYDGFVAGAEFGYNKANEWHNINETEPLKEQFGKQLLIKIESVIGDTDYDYLVYKYKGESISDVAGVLAWKEIE